MSCPFRFSGQPHYRGPGDAGIHTAKHDRFHAATGLTLSCESIDASYCAKEWRGVSPAVEVASVDFDEWRALRAAAEMPLFADLAA